MNWISTTESANRYNKSRQYLNKLHGQGKINRRKRNNKVEFDSDELDQYFGYSEHLKKAQKKETPVIPKRNSGNRKKQDDQKAIKKADLFLQGKSDVVSQDEIDDILNNIDDSGIEPEDLNTLNGVDIALKNSKLVAQNIKNEHDQERLVERDKAEPLFFQIARDTRDAMESIPPRISGLLVGKTKHKIEQMLSVEIKGVLTNLSLNL